MTIVRSQIHCLVSKNDAVIIVIEDDRDATMFQCKNSQERFAHVHHVECDLDQNSSTAVRHHMSLSAFIHIQAIPIIWRNFSQVFAQECPSTKPAISNVKSNQSRGSQIRFF